MDFQAQAPAELYGLPARVATLAPARRPAAVVLPARSVELETNLAGGSVSAKV